jgi:alpha-beta hydrolase superfamily lysophospholipase
VVGAVGVATAAVATYFTRRVVSVDHVKPDDVEVISIDLPVGSLRDGETAGDVPHVALRRTPETQSPGQYGLWFGGRDAHVRVGPVLRDDGDIVVREVLQVDWGVPRPGPARWNQYFYGGAPEVSLGLSHRDVEVSTELGPMPAWWVPGPEDSTTSGTWAVLVHGRGATREECLRAIPPMHELGLPVLVPSYRNDVGAPADPSGRYHLGDSEWRDVEAAVRWALDQGAQDVVLFGWSMGGAIVLQTVARSPLAERVRAVVLVAPVVDWHAVLEHHARVHKLPTTVGRLGHPLLRHPLGRRLIGLRHPLDLRRLDWVRRAAELALPILLIHSDDDEFVPNGPSRALAAARPDLVRFEPWRHARHTKEWNTDPERWDHAVTRFVREQLADPQAVEITQVSDAPSG